MSHTLVVNLSDEAYAELVRASSEERQTPEAIASKILDNVLPDPLLRLSGAIKTPIADIAARHDEYIGEGIHSGHTG
jgi:hypothetical protein